MASCQWPVGGWYLVSGGWLIAAAAPTVAAAICRHPYWLAVATDSRRYSAATKLAAAKLYPRGWTPTLVRPDHLPPQNGHNFQLWSDRRKPNPKWWTFLVRQVSFNETPNAGHTLSARDFLETPGRGHFRVGLFLV